MYLTERNEMYKKKWIKLFLQNLNAVFPISQFSVNLNVRQCLFLPHKSPMISQDLSHIFVQKQALKGGLTRENNVAEKCNN